MQRPGRCQPLQRLVEAMLELAAVGEPGQAVVRGLPGQAGDVFLLAGHVVQHQHRAGEGAFLVERRSDHGDRHRRGVVPPQQLRARINGEVIALQGSRDLAVDLLSGLFVQNLEQ